MALHIAATVRRPRPCRRPHARAHIPTPFGRFLRHGPARCLSLQEILARHKPVINDISFNYIDSIISNTMRSSVVPATLIQLLSSIVARPAATASTFRSHFDTAAGAYPLVWSSGWTPALHG